MTEHELIRRLLFERQFGSGFMSAEIDIDRLIWDVGIRGAVERVSQKLENIKGYDEFVKGQTLAYRRFVQRHRGGFCGRDNMGSGPPKFTLP